MSTVESLTERFLAEAEAKLQEIDAEIEAKIGPLSDARKEVAATVKKLKKGTPTGPKAAPATSDDDIFAAVAELTSGDKTTVTSPEIAEHLGVDPRSIARRLAKHGAEGTSILGNKTDGYATA